MERAGLRSTYRLVGSGHDLLEWKSHSAQDKDFGNLVDAPLEALREYYVPELNASEKVWLPELVDDFARKLPRTAEIFLPDEPLAEDAQVAYLAVRIPGHGDGIIYEILAYRARRMLHVYHLESHNRRFFRSLIYTTDARFTLRALQPSVADRTVPWVAMTRHEAGGLTRADTNGECIVITRSWNTEANLSLGKETYLPGRLLHGVLPQCLIDEFAFWQAEDDEIRGYPIDGAGHDMLLVCPTTGAHVAFFGQQYGTTFFPTDDKRLTLPAKAIILRLKVEQHRSARNDVLAALSSLEALCTSSTGLLSTPFEPTFALCQSIAAVLSKITPATPSFAEAVGMIDLAPLAMQRHSARALLIPSAAAFTNCGCRGC